MAETECGPNDCGLCCRKVKSAPVRVPGGFTYLCAECTRAAVKAWADHAALAGRLPAVGVDP